MGWWTNQTERSRGSYFHGYEVRKAEGVLIKRGTDKRWPLEQCAVAYETGARLQEMSLGRVAAGGLLLGPLGAVLGGMAKKDATERYVVITVPGDAIIEKVLPMEAETAQKFFKYATSAIAQASA